MTPRGASGNIDLCFGERGEDDKLVLWRQPELNVALEPAKQERVEDRVQLADSLVVHLVGDELVGTLGPAQVIVKVKPGLKSGQIGKDVGKDEV